jgi:hypothetical protein
MKSTNDRFYATSLHDHKEEETDFVILSGDRKAWWGARSVNPEEAAKYSDAKLYRILVARALYSGAARNKAEFDKRVRTLGTLAAADELIAFREKRFGCRAWRHGSSMVCECGVSWPVDSIDPPHCKGSST